MTDKLRSLQVLRAVAVLGVLIYHATISKFSVGSAGVDLFFVISGFIITKIAAKRDRAKFLFDRFVRIYPLYFVCALCYWLLVPEPRSTCETLASVTLLPIGCRPYLDPAWTLVFEMTFYALVAVLIRRPVAQALAIVLLVSVGASANIGQAGTPMMMEFLGGVAIAHLPIRERLGLPLLILGIAVLAISPNMNFQPWRFLIWGAPAALIVYSCLCLERHFKEATWDFPVEIGNASYSIYLGHFLVHVAITMWWPLKVLAMLSAGYLLHRAVEKPLCDYFHRKPRRASLDGDAIVRVDRKIDLKIIASRDA